MNPGLANNLLTHAEKQVKKFLTNFERVLETGDVEAVHDLRVASRRLAASLRIVAAYVGSRRVNRIISSLRKTRRAFRKVRDLDVVQISLTGTGPAPIQAPALAHLEGVLTRQREKAIRRARRAVESLDAGALEGDVRALLRQFEASLEELPENNIQVLASEALAIWKGRVAERDPRKPETTHLHETRLCVKRLRYAAELLRDLEGRENDPFISGLAEMQELLGQWHDHLVAAAKIAKIARTVCVRGEDPAWGARLLNYAASRADAAAALRPKIAAAWPAHVENGDKPTASEAMPSRESAPLGSS